MTFDKLEKNLMDVIQEEQAKLGFRREKIRLYYPLTTLNHLLDTEDTAEQMEITLAGQPESNLRCRGKCTGYRRRRISGVAFYGGSLCSESWNDPAQSAA